VRRVSRALFAIDGNRAATQEGPTTSETSGVGIEVERPPARSHRTAVLTGGCAVRTGSA